VKHNFAVALKGSIDWKPTVGQYLILPLSFEWFRIKTRLVTQLID